jgi:hypothetical protein
MLTPMPKLVGLSMCDCENYILACVHEGVDADSSQVGFERSSLAVREKELTL